MRNNSDHFYLCEKVTYDNDVWYRIASIPLVDVVSGGIVKEQTIVKACWDERALYIRFECEDHHTVSDFTNRDDPLFEQDVVEVFIDEEGNGLRYLEIVVSPRNVVFDAKVSHNNPDQPLEFTLDRAWDCDGLATLVENDAGSHVYTIEIPFVNFHQMPREGISWRINFFRIDEDLDGVRHYQAWSPTGIVNFHHSQLFGTIQFINAKEG